MADGALTGLLSYAGWTFIPSYATSLLQKLYYGLTIRAGRQHPLPGQPLYVYHHRRIRIFVLCLYLGYTLVQILYDIKLAGDFYTDLGVTPYSTDREVKARFRRLAARFHPDKVRETGSASPVVEAAFVRLKLAQDTILDIPKRFAYDRFGPRIVQVQNPGLRTIRDYVFAGLRSLIPEYAVGAVSLVFLNYLWLQNRGQYWRYLAISTLILLELFFLTHTWQPPTYTVQLGSVAKSLLPSLIPAHLLPFQILTIARRMLISLNIFISQLAPLGLRSTADEDRQTTSQIAHLMQASSRIDAEASGLLNFGLAPFRGDKEIVTILRTGMKEGIIMSSVRSSPGVREAIRQVMDRRKDSEHDGGQSRIK